MIDRRQLLATGAALSALGAAAPGLAARTEPNPADRELDALLESQLETELSHTPQQLTLLGLDDGENAQARYRLNPTGLAAEKAGRARLDHRVAELQAFDTSRLSALGRLNYDVMLFKLESLKALSDSFDYGVTRGPYFTPFIVTQLTGAWYEVPDFLDNDHPVEDASDAEAYLSRLEAFAAALDGETERIGHDADLGVAPPAFMLDRTISALADLRDESPDTARLVQSIAERAGEIGLNGYETRARDIFVSIVRPALTRQIAELERLRTNASDDAGCWRLPQGEEIYRLGLYDNTTRSLSGEDVHEIGLRQVSEIQAELDKIMRAAGYAEGSVGERLRTLAEDPEYLFEDSDAGRAEIIAYVEGLVTDIGKRLPEAFLERPDTPLSVRRVPVAIQDGAPGGYYAAAPLDGSRPAYYNINLADVRDWPRWSLPALTHHEAIPGHHFQISMLRQTSDLPLYRRLLKLTAYTEGWALYAEKVARELDVYEGDPVGVVGQLQSALFRAVRLVVDSGMHHKRWSREEAIKYMMTEGGEPESSAIREIERYAVWPGNACAYKMGEITISELRDMARARLGGRFDIKRFHDVVLRAGPIPLAVLEDQILDWIA